MFYDLNIKRLDSNPSKIRALISEAHTRGYNAVAVTTEWTEEATETGNKRKRKAVEGPMPPVNVAEFADIPVKIYNRINILVKDPAVFHKLNKMRELKAYDVVSYTPGNASVLKALPNIPDFDLLTFDPLIETEPLHFNRKLYKQFVQNGVYMELPYAPSILDSTFRKYSIFTAHVYHAIGKSENIIVTSGASEIHSLRSPYDIINLCSLYGLSEGQAKSSITRNCESLLLKARTRRRGKSTVEIINVN